MFIEKYISIPLFLVSLTLGLLFVYVLGPEKKVIYIFPTPSNYLKYQYKDSADECFEYKPNIVKCPLNPLEINTIPIQK